MDYDTVTLNVTKDSTVTFEFTCARVPNEQGFQFKTDKLQADNTWITLYNLSLDDNVQRKDCGPNCESYTVTPNTEGFYLFTCTQGTTVNQQKSCHVHVNITHSPQSKLNVLHTLINIITLIINFVIIINFFPTYYILDVNSTWSSETSESAGNTSAVNITAVAASSTVIFMALVFGGILISIILISAYLSKKYRCCRGRSTTNHEGHSVHNSEEGNFKDVSGPKVRLNF